MCILQIIKTCDLSWTSTDASQSGCPGHFNWISKYLLCHWQHNTRWHCQIQRDRCALKQISRIHDATSRAVLTTQRTTVCGFTLKYTAPQLDSVTVSKSKMVDHASMLESHITGIQSYWRLPSHSNPYRYVCDVWPQKSVLITWITQILVFQLWFENKIADLHATLVIWVIQSQAASSKCTTFYCFNDLTLCNFLSWNRVNVVTRHNTVMP